MTNDGKATAKAPSRPGPLVHWYNAAEACERLGTSLATIERRVKRGDIEKRQRPRGNGRKPEPVYNPADIERLTTGISAQVLPPLSKSDPVNASNAVSKTRNFDGMRADDEIMRALGLLMAARPPEPKLYLTVPEAAAASGLSEALLRRLCRTGKIGFRDGSTYKIGRAELAGIGQLAK